MTSRPAASSWRWRRPDATPACSEAAVALLLGSTELLREKGKALRPQGWLLRQITGDADQVEKLLSLLLNAEQVPRERIRHFWHSRLRGLAQHATMGAVQESGLKMGEHVLDKAVGPQAPVARGVLQALAASMAHFGQGAQLVALPHGNGVALNLAVKEPTSVNVPWKHEYGYRLFPFPEIGVCMILVTLALLLSDNQTWGTFETVVVSSGFVLCMLFTAGRVLMRKVYVDNVWHEYG